MARDLETVAAAVAMLNEIVAEVAVKVGEPDWSELVLGLLQEANWALGFEFQGERGDPDRFMSHGHVRGDPGG